MRSVSRMVTLARAYVAAGLSVIPIKPDGSKRPPIKWKEYQSRHADDQELQEWFAAGRHGIAVICGQVSGGLEVLDFDSADAWRVWSRLCEEEHPGLLARLPRVRTPAGGMHLYYRVDEPGGNQKLAWDQDGLDLIETRGEGGYVLAPGCPPACHPDGLLYELMPGPDLSLIPHLDEVLS